jgi:peptide/nickel transport system substrate-binding protein
MFLIALILFCGFSCSRKEQGSDTLIIGVVSDVASMNPLLTRSRFDAEISQMLFLTLMQEQPDLVTFTPELAKSWDILEDGKKIVFHLRTDVYWSDGIKTTAQDVKFTFEKQTADSLAWAGASVKTAIKDVQALDDSTVQFIFAEPYLYQLMDINDGVILPAHILGKLALKDWKDSAFNTNPVTNGPYKLKSWAPNQYIELAGNERFYDAKQPQISNIIFKVVPDQTQLATQINTGEVQVVDGLAASEAAKVGRESDKIRIEHFPFGQLVQVSYNLNNSLFADKQVRRALTLAIDRQALVDHLLSGYGKVCTSPLHPMLWAYDSNLKPLPYSPEEARSLLQQTGWQDADNDGVLERNGIKFEFELLTNIGSQTREDAQLMIQDMLKKVGIKVVPQRLEWSVYVEKLSARQYDAVLIGLMSATKVDPFPAWHSSMIGPDGFNLSCYVNPEADDLIDRGRTLADREQALPIWYEFQRKINEDAPATFLWLPERIVALDSRLKSYKFSPVSTFYNLSEWRF